MKGAEIGSALSNEENNVAFNEETKFGELLDNPAAKAILTRYIPQLADPGIKLMLSMARGMSLKTVSGYPQAGLTAEKFSALIDELSAI